MLLKRIKAATLAEAIEKTRAACGEDALLIDTRKTQSGYLIVAARPPQPNTRAAKATTTGRAGWTRGFAPLAESAQSFGLSRPILSAVEKAMIGTRVELGRAGDPALPSIAARIFKALVKTTEMSLPDFKVTALVGPTGVGKTTTLAKLAAAAVRDRRESTAIVTIDTYRVAAAEQLRAFAEMLAVPFAVASSQSDLRRVLDAHAGVDRIFVDTSGHGPFDHEAIGTLQDLLDPGGLCAALCICAHSRRIDVLATISAFKGIDPSCAILTKWDETVAPGEALSVLIEQGLPLSHITVGQEVPQDIVDARAGALAARAFALPEEAATGVL